MLTHPCWYLSKTMLVKWGGGGGGVLCHCCRRYFQTHFLEWKCLYFDSNLKSVPKDPMANKPAFICASDVLVYWRIHAWFGLGESKGIHLFQPPRLLSRYLCFAKTSCPAPAPVYPAVWTSTLASTLYVSCSQPRTQRHCLAWTGSSLGPEMWVMCPPYCLNATWTLSVPNGITNTIIGGEISTKLQDATPRIDPSYQKVLLGSSS